MNRSLRVSEELLIGFSLITVGILLGWILFHNISDENRPEQVLVNATVPVQSATNQMPALSGSPASPSSLPSTASGLHATSTQGSINTAEWGFGYIKGISKRNGSYYITIANATYSVGNKYEGGYRIDTLGESREFLVEAKASISFSSPGDVLVDFARLGIISASDTTSAKTFTVDDLFPKLLASDNYLSNHNAFLAAPYWFRFDLAYDKAGQNGAPTPVEVTSIEQQYVP